MRYVTKHPKPDENLVLTEEEQKEVAEAACLELDDALAARHPQSTLWVDLLRGYDGVPELLVRNTPIENAPNYEVTLGAIEADTVYSQAVDTIFNQVSPLATCKPTKDDKQLSDTVAKFQRWINHIADFESDIREAGEHCALDWAQLGTGFLYIPWINESVHHQNHEIKNVGARVLPHPLEDVILPAGAYHDIQRMPWVALRFWYNQAELDALADDLGWDTSGCVQAGMPGYVRSYRERLSRQWQSNKGATPFSILYQIVDFYAYMPIRGKMRDVLLSIDYTARKLVDYRYNPYLRRPIRKACYQKRAHLPYAIGILEMLQGYQQQLSDCHNDAQLNSHLANIKMFKGKPNAVPGGVVKAYPWKVVETMEPDQFGELKTSDVYPSTYRNEANIVNYAEQRVGVRNLSGPSPANVMGGRTPGITAMTVVQKTSQRFATAFDDLRFCIAGGLMECAWRYREQLLAGGEARKLAEQNILAVMGQEDGKFIVDLLLSDDFEHSVKVEMTASSAFVNRVQDRQESIQLGQYIMTYGEKAVQFLTIAGNPQTPEAVRTVASEIAKVINAVITHTVRTFDSIHDPSEFILNLEEAVNQVQSTPDAMGQLLNIVSQLGGGGQGNGQALLGGNAPGTDQPQ